MASEGPTTATDTPGVSSSENPVEKVLKLRIRCPPFNPVIELNANASYADLLKAGMYITCEAASRVSFSVCLVCLGLLSFLSPFQSRFQPSEHFWREALSLHHTS